MPRKEQKIYLSFDDGPHPEITLWVISELKKYNAKATFFCVGDNLKKHPQVADLIKASGHVIGNHTQNHLNGWKTSLKPYLKNVQQANAIEPCTLFRPPYGKISRSQLTALQKQYKVVFWDVLAGDFDKNLSPDYCIQHIKKYTKAGSIIVFHDSEKAWKKLKIILPEILEYYSKNGFIFDSIQQNALK